MLTASANICMIRECVLGLPTDRRGALYLLLNVPLLSRRTQPTSFEVGRFQQARDADRKDLSWNAWYLLLYGLQQPTSL